MSKKILADVAQEVEKHYAPLNWVGMNGIELSVCLNLNNQKFQIPAKANAKVSLDKSNSRGIHMSRLFLICQQQLPGQNLTPALLGNVVQEFLKTHEDLSSKAKVEVSFEAPILRAALKSENFAWRNYPVTIMAEVSENSLEYFVEVVVTYSSTCPASAALSRQLIQEAFEKKFESKGSTQELTFESVHAWLGTTDGIVATPHAQRSLAKVKVQVKPDFNFVELIDLIEESLQTPVQGAVKRVDEQEFALRNGQNLMFCEDAARRVQSALNSMPAILDYTAHFDHIESLHPHSAVSEVSKGLKLGQN